MQVSIRSGMVVQGFDSPAGAHVQRVLAVVNQFFMSFLNVFSISVVKKHPVKRHVWMYQFEGGRPQEIIKEGRWWYFNTEQGGETGCDTLAGAKQDLLYSGAKVWREVK